MTPGRARDLLMQIQRLRPGSGEIIMPTWVVNELRQAGLTRATGPLKQGLELDTAALARLAGLNTFSDDNADVAMDGVIGHNADGAMVCGTRVQKIGTEPGDTHPDGTLATVLGSAGAEDKIGYFVEWDDVPGLPVFIAGNRIKEAP